MSAKHAKRCILEMSYLILCKVCGKEAKKIKHYIKDGKLQTSCEYCYLNWVDEQKNKNKSESEDDIL